MTQEEQPDGFDGLLPESEQEHANLDAYKAAVAARLSEIIASPEIGGTRAIIDDLSNPATPIHERERYLSDLVELCYVQGIDDEQEIAAGRHDNEDLRVIINYRNRERS